MFLSKSNDKKNSFNNDKIQNNKQVSKHNNIKKPSNIMTGGAY